MKKLTAKEKKQYIERIMEDVSTNLYQYKGFVLDCVRDIVKNWDDHDLRDWCGERD